jgi:hypothetical protein
MGPESRAHEGHDRAAPGAVGRSSKASPVMGSPAISGSKSSRTGASRLRSFFYFFRRPAATGRRTWSTGRSASESANSTRPRRIVFRQRPRSPSAVDRPPTPCARTPLPDTSAFAAHPTDSTTGSSVGDTRGSGEPHLACTVRTRTRALPQPAGLPSPSPCCWHSTPGAHLTGSPQNPEVVLLHPLSHQMGLPAVTASGRK